MLDVMDLPPAAAWLVLGGVLGALLVVAVVAGFLAARRRRSLPRDAAPGVAPRVDDLADFLEHPPGTRPGHPAAAGWVALTGPAPTPATTPPPGADGRDHLRLAVLAVVALALVGTAAAVATAVGREEPRAAPSRPTAAGDAGPDPGRTEGRLTSAGLVLQRRAVGVTAAYPEVRLSTDGDTARVELRLPTWNCLRTEAPDDPVAAGCVRSIVEHAELGSPDLAVERDGDRLRVHGRVTTSVHSAGSAPEPTGRSYDVELTVAPGRAGEGDASTAVGAVWIGTATAPLVEELSELRSS